MEQYAFVGIKKNEDFICKRLTSNALGPYFKSVVKYSLKYFTHKESGFANVDYFWPQKCLLLVLILDLMSGNRWHPLPTFRFPSPFGRGAFPLCTCFFLKMRQRRRLQIFIPGWRKFGKIFAAQVPV